MDNFPIATLAQQESPIHRAISNSQVKFSFIALKDLAAASATVLEEREKHFYAQYPLVSAGPHSYEEVVAIVEKEMGKQIRIQQIPYAEAVEGGMKRIAGTADPDPRTRNGLERLVLFYERRGLLGNSNQLAWLLGKSPISYAEWAREKLHGQNLW